MALFDVTARAYVRFMGRFSVPLAPAFADLGLAGVPPDARVLDVGCGPGMLTDELATRRGERRVVAVDPAPELVATTASSYPQALVARARAEALPFPGAAFGATLAQLVVHFLTDPVAGVREMVRVTVPGGRVSACVWDHAGGSGPLSSFWSGVHRIDPAATDEGRRPGTRQGDLTEIFRSAGLRDVVEERLTVTVAFSSFEDWWEPFAYGVGPAGQYVRRLDAPARERLAAVLLAEHGHGPFEIEAAAWAAVGVA